MFNILTYVRVPPATADVHIILEVPATDKIHIEDRYGLAELSQTMGYTTRCRIQLPDSHVNSYILIMWCQKGQSSNKLIHQTREI